MIGVWLGGTLEPPSLPKKKTQPPTVVDKMEAQSEYCMYTLYTLLCTLGIDLYAQLALISNIYALEFSQKFIKSPLLVGEKNNSQRRNSYPALFFSPRLLDCL